MEEVSSFHESPLTDSAAVGFLPGMLLNTLAEDLGPLLLFQLFKATEAEQVEWLSFHER